MTRSKKTTLKKTTKRTGIKDSSRGTRLNKVLAEAGIGSRRSCDELIELGEVAVNGEIVKKMPVWVNPEEDRVTVGGRSITRGKRPQGRLYLMVSKPRNVICTNYDPEGRRRVIDLVPHKERLYTVGRLDADSTGLVLLTNDGELTEKLTHPKYGIAKTYHVTIKGRLEESDIEKMRKGIYLADEQTGRPMRARVANVKLVTRHHDKSQIEITLREGKNREVRRILARLGHPVKKLRRVSIGPLRLKGVSVGQWRALTRSEITSLKRAANRTTKKTT